MSEMSNKIGLSEAITVLRKQLIKAQDKGKDEGLRFKIEDINLELQVVAENEVHADGGVKFWVYNAQAGGKLSSQVMQKISLKLKPETSSGDNFELNDED